MKPLALRPAAYMIDKDKKGIIVVCVFMCMLGASHAADGTWTNLESGQLWSSTGNWAGGIVADGSGFTADFSALDITADTTGQVDSARTIGNIVFGDTATGSAASWTLNNNGNSANILTLVGTTPTITVNALGTGKKSTVLGVIAGSSGLTKNGPGWLSFPTLGVLGSLAKTYSGGTVINAGTLEVGQNGGGNVLAAGAITINDGATLATTANNVNFSSSYPITLGAGNCTIKNGGGSFAFSCVISGSGNLAVDTPSGKWTALSGANTFTGETTTLGAGTLRSNNLLALQNSTVNYTSGNLVWNVAGMHVLGGLKGSKNLSAFASGQGLKIGNNNSNTTYSGVISGVAGDLGVIKIGTGTLTLSGANTYWGSTTVSNGVLKLDSTGSVASTNIVLGATGILDVTAKASYTMAAANTYTFVIDPAGSGSSGQIEASGLDISSGNVVLDVLDTLNDEAYMLASYTSRIGSAFVGSTTPPEGYEISYAYQGNKIALVKVAAGGTVFFFR